MHKALESLGIVGPMPDYQLRCERVPKRSFESPTAIVGFDYHIVVSADGVPQTEMVWSEEIQRFGG